MPESWDSANLRRACLDCGDSNAELWVTVGVSDFAAESFPLVRLAMNTYRDRQMALDLIDYERAAARDADKERDRIAARVADLEERAIKSGGK